MLGNGPLCKILYNGIGHWAAYNSDVFGPFCPVGPVHLPTRTDQNNQKTPGRRGLAHQRRRRIPVIPRVGWSVEFFFYRTE